MGWSSILHLHHGWPDLCSRRRIANVGNLWCSLNLRDYYIAWLLVDLHWNVRLDDGWWLLDDLWRRRLTLGMLNESLGR